MPVTAPINIAVPFRHSYSSPSSQGAALKKSTTTTITTTTTTTNNNHNNNRFLHVNADSYASAMMSGATTTVESTAVPISMNIPTPSANGRARRESLAGSVAQGMSWGGVSVGSWIRDDIIMAGTSPFPYQSPSYHSSSYLPKLEANFMKDFACCGQTLPTLHDLLQHFEEAHAKQNHDDMRTPTAAARPRENPAPHGKAALAAQAATLVQQQAQQPLLLPNPQLPAPRPHGLQMPPSGPSVGGIQLMRQQQQSQPSTPLPNHVPPIVGDMDVDMELDDAMGPLDHNSAETPTPMYQPTQSAQQSFNFGQPPRPNLNLNQGSMQHSGLRTTSQPPTPSTAGFGYQHNPTVSSVNTPTLSAQPTHQQSHQFSPDDSVPSTPAGEMEDSFANMPTDIYSIHNVDMTYTAPGLGNYPFGMDSENLSLDLCIDEPAKRLYSPNGVIQQRLQQQFAQFGLGQGQFGNNDELMRAYRQQQMMAMNAMPHAGLMLGEEHKPFRCPVIGCEKAYKNQNGLKYHKTHGHQTQQLHENGDGTFSIVNPETSVPYPGTLGMEKEKPYKCDVCGKRYKNLNGLKYHKQHSPPCNPELKLNSHMAAAGLGPLGMNIPGLPGIGEESMM
ncbi:hypothetical protein LZ554_008277 [Drepanopeziza brunnea f. sp. 'monogermtubi']|nr:hypothetical protein LZ554_008277 [Drepanopeziza brunnea f. sp. 'monogermtubi']